MADMPIVNTKAAMPRELPDGLGRQHLEADRGVGRHASVLSIIVLGIVMIVALSGALGGGFNSRLDELQAALLRVSLRRLAADVAERQRLADRYLTHLRVPALPCSVPGTDHAYHLFVVRHPDRE